MLAWSKQFAIDTFYFNSLVGFFIYWIPIVLCVVGYTIRTFRNVQKDREARAREMSNYYPTDTIGDVIGRAFVSFIPVANFWAAYFDVCPDLFSKFFKWLEKVFDQPLVPKRTK
jgi:hypothetical protein